MARNARHPVVAGVCLAFLLAAPVGAAADQKPISPLVKEGVALHDKGEFDKAIEKFEEALKADPNDTTALYEMANTYWVKKDYKKVLELGNRGVRAAKGCDAGQFYMVIANAQDDMGDGDGAIETYKAGVRECPTFSGLHFNLAVAYLNKNLVNEAREELKKDVSLEPKHPSGHFYLARLYEAQGYRVPALLAYCWFLVLEPNTARSKTALQSVDALMKQGYARNAATGNVTLTLDAGAKKDEGDFGAAEAAILISSAATQLKDRPDGPADPAVAALKSALIVIGELENTGPGFASEFYRPYYSALARQPHVEAFAYAVMFASGRPAVKDWIGKNQKAIADLIAWSSSFNWPVTKL